MLRFALNHFDRIYSQPVFQTLMQQEMIRLHRGEANALSPLVEKLFRPMAEKVFALAEEGIRSGELIPVESSQLIYAALGANVFYFLSAPMMQILVVADPFEPAALEFRRRAAVEFLGQAIFIDREHGARVAARVLAETPMPENIVPPTDPFRDVRIEKANIDAGQTSAIEVRHK